MHRAKLFSMQSFGLSASLAWVWCLHTRQTTETSMNVGFTTTAWQDLRQRYTADVHGSVFSSIVSAHQSVGKTFLPGDRQERTANRFALRAHHVLVAPQTEKPNFAYGINYPVPFARFLRIKLKIAGGTTSNRTMSKLAYYRHTLALTCAKSFVVL